MIVTTAFVAKPTTAADTRPRAPANTIHDKGRPRPHAIKIIDARIVDQFVVSSTTYHRPTIAFPR